MNPRSIYSKSGKGVQEASGKTSLLKRGERAVLSAIDGRATLAEVAQKVGKTFDAAFQALIIQLDTDGFVREVTAAPGVSSTTSQRTAAARTPAPKLAPAGGGAADLDFTSVLSKMSSTPARPAEARAKEQEAALYKAREEAEARAQAERERVRVELEAKARAETEAKIRAETEKRMREEAAAKQKAEAQAKARAEAEAAAKATREAAARAAAEAKAKAEAEARAKIEAERKAREEAERARAEAERRAREEAERARQEAERVRREAEELRQRLEDERRAREEAERKRREEEERRAREEAERKRKEEEERRAREEAERKRREEEERRARDEAERKRKEEEERREREEAERQAREEEERARRAEEETRIRQAALEVAAPAAGPDPEATSLDALMADLHSFSEREEQEREQQEAAARQAREEAMRKAQEAERARKEAEQRAREEAERARAAEEQRRREEEERRAQAEAESRARQEEERRLEEAVRLREEEERRLEEERVRKAREAAEAAQVAAASLASAGHLEEERVRMAREAAGAAQVAAATSAPSGQNGDIVVSDDELDMDDVRHDAQIQKQARKAQREREREARKREKARRKREARERAEAARQAARERRVPRRPVRWGKPLAMTLLVALVLGVGALHVLPLPMGDYEQAASAAFGRPVRVDSGRFSLIGGVHLKLEGVRVGDKLRIAEVRAYPQLSAFLEERKAFKRVELERLVLSQDALADVLFGQAKWGERFSIASVVVNQLRLDGPLALPPLEMEAVLGTDGAVRSVRLRGPDGLAATLTPAGKEVAFDVTASSFTVPFTPALTLHSFAMKGRATRESIRISEWGGALYDGALSGAANVRWSGNWEVNGAVTVRNINAAVFAPALLSEGKAEGSGKFSMAGGDPGKLASGARLEGNFTVYKGVLGSFDLSRVIQTGGRQHAGRTQFVELKGQGIYDRGAVALRDVAITAGALHAGAHADIAQNGALSGRIVTDVNTTSHTLRQTIVLGGTVKEPQVRN